MPRRADGDRGALARLLPPGRAVATHAELRDAGVPMSTITHRIRPGGPWARILPGVVLAHRGTPTPFERRLAAVKYAGSGARLTGLDALAESGVATARRLGSPRVHVLVPHTCRRTSHGFALVTRTRRDDPVIVERGLRCSTLARATIDACRWLVRLDDVRGLIADVVQHHGVSAADLVAEVRAAARQRTALSNAVLREIWEGIRSVAEARLRAALRRAGIPQPLWNHELRQPSDGSLVAVPDALWPEVGLVAEIDSMAWHLSPASYRRTQARQRRLVLAGFEVLPISPADLVDDPDAVCAQIRHLLATLPPRPLQLLVQPAA